MCTFALCVCATKQARACSGERTHTSPHIQYTQAHKLHTHANAHAHRPDTDGHKHACYTYWYGYNVQLNAHDTSMSTHMIPLCQRT
jgi:hypothetical protein